MVFTNFLLKAYTLINRSSVLESPWIRRQFARTYFIYKQHLESPYAGLVRSHPELFQGGHIIDIGANIGYTATIFAKASDPQFKVYAFEPDPVNFAMLVEMIDTGGHRNKIVPIQAAIGQLDGTVELWRNPTSHADHRVWTPEFKAALPEIAQDLVSVPLMSLDSFLAREHIAPAPCFVKIRVQGYELPVFSGLQRTLDSGADMTITFPYAPEVMKTLGFEPTEVIEMFASRGFVFYIIDGKGKLFNLPNPRTGLTDFGPQGYHELLLSRKPLRL